MNAADHPHGPEPLDTAIRAVRAMPVPPCPADDDWVARTFPGPSPGGESPPHSRRNLLMRVVPLSAAAAALIAVGLAALFTTPASVALGDVIQAAKQHKLVKYTLIQGAEAKDGSVPEPQRLEAFADLRSPRFRATERAGSPLVPGAFEQEIVLVMDGTKGLTFYRFTRTVTEKGKTDPEAIEIVRRLEAVGPSKRVVLSDFTGRGPINNPKKSLLESLRALETHRNALATKGKFRGKDILRYHIEDAPWKMTLLVDAATRLPIRLESEYAVSKEELDSQDPGGSIGGGFIKETFVMSDFEWDPALKGFKDADDLFSTEPPAGYEVQDLRRPTQGSGK